MKKETRIDGPWELGEWKWDKKKPKGPPLERIADGENWKLPEVDEEVWLVIQKKMIEDMPWPDSGPYIDPKLQTPVNGKEEQE